MPIRDSRDKRYDVVKNRPAVGRPQPNVTRPNREVNNRPVRKENNDKGRRDQKMRPENNEHKEQHR